MTRHERKMARNARLSLAGLLDHQIKATMAARRKVFEREYLVSSGAVPLVDYQPPTWRYLANPEVPA
jgi:hypothetical protein